MMSRGIANSFVAIDPARMPARHAAKGGCSRRPRVPRRLLDHVLGRFLHIEDVALRDPQGA
jgi:hypothetical protein